MAAVRVVEHLFLQTFWQTMIREWTGIDRLRLDKFYMLMRMVLNESLQALKTRGWEERQMEQLLDLLTTEILHPDSGAPSGVKSHFIEIFLEELAKVGSRELTADQNLRLIDPFCTIAAQTQDPVVLNNVARGIFEAIVEQAPLAIEDLLNELGEEEASEGAEQERAARSEEPYGKPKGSFCGAELDVGEEQAGDDEDSASAVLQFDYEAVANRLFEAASRQSTPSHNRKRLYKVVRKLQDLAAGLFPEDDVPERAYRSLREGRRATRTKKRGPRSRLRDETGPRGREGVCGDPSSGPERTRQGTRADPAAPQEQPRGRARRGARKRRRPRAGARKQVPGCRGPEVKKQRTRESEK